jgi:polysaccharide deacetylase family protein (PEP-CTERM system associated)
MGPGSITNALTVDFEDWYQGLEIPCAQWDGFEDRIAIVGRKLLQILDEVGTKATFFVLGFVAEKHPDIIREIDNAGHEIGTHGFSHTLIYKQTPQVFRGEMERAISFLEDLTGKKVIGHRAPFFSITKDSLWALDILAELGIRYDSSIFPVLNYRYGIADAPRFPYDVKCGEFTVKEFPISTLQFPKVTLPISGGAYFRIYPYQLTKQAIRAVNRSSNPVTFYLHPWELDADHPRIDLPRRIALTHYFNLGATEKRFRRLLRDFRFASMAEVLGLDAVESPALPAGAVSGPRFSIRVPKPNPVRVLHVITRMIVGGAQENTLLSVEGLDRLPEYEVTLVSGVDRGLEGNLLPRARQTTRLIVVPELGRSINPVNDAIALWKLYRLIRDGRYHIVHTHSSKASVLGRIAAKLAGTPINLETLHGHVFHSYQPWMVNRLWRTVYKMCALMTDHFISVADLVSREAILAGVDHPDKFSTIYSGMELDWFLNARVDPGIIRSEFGIPEDALVVGKIARLFPLKGHDELMNAAPEIVHRVPNVRFFLVGDGILQNRLKDRAEKLGILSNFIFAGLIERERIPEMISVMDVVVHTSLREGLARVLPQALAMGKPCVSFDIGGAAEVVIPGETGYIVTPGDAGGLAAAVSRLLSDPQLRARMGEAGRRKVDPMFRAETMVAQIAALYAQLVARHMGRIVRFDRVYRQRVAEVCRGVAD